MIIYKKYPQFSGKYFCEPVSRSLWLFSCLVCEIIYKSGPSLGHIKLIINHFNLLWNLHKLSILWLKLSLCFLHASQQTCQNINFGCRWSSQADFVKLKFLTFLLSSCSRCPAAPRRWCWGPTCPWNTREDKRKKCLGLVDIQMRVRTLWNYWSIWRIGPFIYSAIQICPLLIFLNECSARVEKLKNLEAHTLHQPTWLLYPGNFNQLCWTGHIFAHRWWLDRLIK